MTDKTQPDSGRATGGIVEMLHARIAELEARVQELGAMARENRSRRIVELEAQLEAVGAGGVQTLSAGPVAIAKLRHLYQNMVNGAVRDTASAKRIAEGLLAPAIEALERATPTAEQQAAPKAAPGPVSDTQHSQFLSDVLTAAGLITHGKRCKALGERLSDMVMRLRAAPQPAPAPLMPRGDSAAPQLRAMATNYPPGHLWDKLDAKACIKGALEIEALRAPQPAPAPLSRDQIREVFMAHGFTIKEGQTDLKQYVYDAAYALLGTKPAPLSDDVVQKTWALLDELEKLRGADRYDEDWVTLNKRDDELRAVLDVLGGKV